jgi:NADH-quinone oxidoreductase subunit H
MLSYELSVALAVVGILMTYGDANISHIVEAQGQPWVWLGHPLPLPPWGLFTQPIGFVLFLVGSFAETNRNPFDLPEGESELVGGYHTEYSSMKFALFFMAEYSHMTVASVVLATLFLGGYQVPFVPTEVLRSHPREILWVFAALAVVAGLALGSLFTAMGIHKPYEKGFRRNEMYVYAGGVFGLALTALVAACFLPGADLPSWLPGPLTVLTQVACLMSKALFFCWLFVWVRWTLPRFRFDQLMGLGWKVLLPLGLVNVALTGIWSVMTR